MENLLQGDGFNLIVMIIVGAIAGSLAARVIRGDNFGFIINAIDKRNGILTAFNTGTGVIPEYRGKRIVKSIYAHAIGELRQQGVEKSTLEVITKNDIAIRSYKSIGFSIRRRQSKLCRSRFG